MNITVLFHPKSRDRLVIEDAVEIVNQLQEEFVLSIKTADWIPNSSSTVYPWKLANRARKKWPQDKVIVFVRGPLKDKYFDYPSRGLNVVSTSGWEKDFAPPPLKVYAVFQIAYALGAFVANLPYRQLKKLMHRAPRGCLFDVTIGRAEFRLSLVAAYLCAECEATLSEWGVSDKQLKSINDVLSYVREFAIRKPRARPTAVFIGHGRRPDWEKVKGHLSSMGVEVDDFTVPPTAGITTVERLSQMLERACFAILVMTAEDRRTDGNRYARQNVVHEIGLFQGRLGFRKSIIVMERTVQKFSNIDGLTYIPYPRGKIQHAFPEIDRALVRERVIEAGRPASRP